MLVTSENYDKIPPDDMASNQETGVYFWRSGSGGDETQLSGRPHPKLPFHCEVHDWWSDLECPAVHGPLRTTAEWTEADNADFADKEPGMADDYDAFLAHKTVRAESLGMAHPPSLDSRLFGFQRESVEWALRLGRAALFLDCGLGKTACQVTWAKAIAEHTGRPVLILAPLAVSQQTVREGVKFGVDVRYCLDGSMLGNGVNITNYERLGKFDCSVFGGVVLDESSILKSYSGTTKQALINSFVSTPFKLACTATPAPNDHIELGNHAEFLGVMSSHEMLARWFLNDTSLFGNYRLKGHAVTSFWDWVTSWARCAGSPSDLGYADDGFVLPPLDLIEHTVDVDITSARGEQLFRIPDLSATAVHAEKRRTADYRARAVAELVAAQPDEQWLLWADTDYEADAVRAALPSALDVRGSDSLAKKEAALMGFADGDVRTLLTKPKLAGMGLNFQRCARVAFVGPSFSYEAFYQAVRRVWRFGQTRAVEAHIFLASTERQIWNVVRSKAEGHDALKVEMFAAARRAAAKESRAAVYAPTVHATLPTWLKEM